MITADVLERDALVAVALTRGFSPLKAVGAFEHDGTPPIRNVGRVVVARVNSDGSLRRLSREEYGALWHLAEGTDL